MNLELEYVTMTIHKSRQHELEKEAEQHRLATRFMELLRRDKHNPPHTEEDTRKSR